MSMSIVNRRNAFLGWLAFMVGKRVVRRKMRRTTAAFSRPRRLRPRRRLLAR
jgi:hypothetical protein